MKKTFINELSEKKGKPAEIFGWVKNIRLLGKICFIHLRDSTGWCQIVLREDLKNFSELSKITPESAVKIKGIIKENSQSKQGFEVDASEFEIVSISETPLPIDISEKSQTKIDKRIDYRFLDARKEEVNFIFKMRSKLYREIVDFMDNESFVNISTPKITEMGAESGAELFKIDYFGKPAFLSQSPQIYKQMFGPGCFENVYEFGPVFRAEKSHTTRHQTEFTGFDFEMSWINNEDEIMDFIEKMVKVAFIKAAEKFGVKINVPEKIPRMTLKDAFDLMKEKQDHDFSPEQEKKIGEIVQKKYNSDFVFITKYPLDKRPFYHMIDENGTTRSFDLFWNGLEICTGAQREHRIDVLKKQADEKGVDLKNMAEYLDIFRYGIPPHGGAGFGFDRMIEALLKLDNVREVILLARDVERLKP